MASGSFVNATLHGNRKRKMLKSLTIIRVFFVIALFAAGIVELWASSFFSTPLSQLTVSAVAGAIGVVAAKFAHIV